MNMFDDASLHVIAKSGVAHVYFSAPPPKLGLFMALCGKRPLCLAASCSTWFRASGRTSFGRRLRAGKESRERGALRPVSFASVTWTTSSPRRGRKGAARSGGVISHFGPVQLGAVTCKP